MLCFYVVSAQSHKRSVWMDYSRALLQSGMEGHNELTHTRTRPFPLMEFSYTPAFSQALIKSCVILSIPIAHRWITPIIDLYSQVIQGIYTAFVIFIGAIARKPPPSMCRPHFTVVAFRVQLHGYTHVRTLAYGCFQWALSTLCRFIQRNTFLFTYELIKKNPLVGHVEFVLTE